VSSVLSAFGGTGGIYASAIDYHDAGFSVIPCRVDKRPAIDWQEYQERLATYAEIDNWFSPRNATTHPSIGVVLGAVSGKVVCIDLDGFNAVSDFYSQFPKASGLTLTVASGSGQGLHLYFRVDKIPTNISVHTEKGGFEIRGNGQYVIAPPSPHPSGKRYKAIALRPIAHIPHLEHVRSWFESLRKSETQERSREIASAAKPVDVFTSVWKKHYLEKVVSQELARVATASVGSRNKSLFYAALRLANYCAGGELDRSDIEARLLTAASSAHIPAMEAQRTIASAFNIGWKKPKQVPPPSEA
jgi:Bifunctional DNA primase/polymerase, N-terminal